MFAVLVLIWRGIQRCEEESKIFRVELEGRTLRIYSNLMSVR